MRRCLLLCGALMLGAAFNVEALQWVAVDERLKPLPAPVVFRDHLRSGQPCAYCPELVRLPPGHFLMGAFPWDGHGDEHGPDGSPFRVKLSVMLAMSTFEISRAQFAAFLQASPGYSPSKACSGLVNGVFEAQIDQGWRQPGFEQTPNEPVVCISWPDAQAYTRWLSQQTGARYRLPTEAEWEYAAKAGSLTRYWWGDRIGKGRANCRDSRCDQSYATTAPPLAMPPNRFGLYHMLGNVWEWVADCYDAGAYRLNADRYPAAVEGAGDCKRVIRGGSWAEGVWSLRSANREGWLPLRPLNDIGFRVVREGGDVAL